LDACSPALLVWAADGVQVDSLQAVFGIIAAGNSVRHVAGTNVNSRSSRSHTLLMMQLTQPSTAPEDEQGGGTKTKKQREKEREQAQMLHAPPAATTTISTLQVTRDMTCDNPPFEDPRSHASLSLSLSASLRLSPPLPLSLHRSHAHQPAT